MTESVTNPFVMHGARDALLDGLGHMDAQVNSIEKAVFENPGIAFDLAKRSSKASAAPYLTNFPSTMSNQTIYLSYSSQSNSTCRSYLRRRAIRSRYAKA